MPMISTNQLRMTPGLRKLHSHLEHIRTVPERTLFLDIETTGLSRHYHYITVVGFIINGRYDCIVAGDDLSSLRRATEAADMLVTFNGAGFDLPFIRQEFPDIELPERHIDLRYACRYVGLTGGQKKIEKEIGLPRDSDVDGAGAVLLWHRYVAGDQSALGELLHYNYLDVAGMVALLDHVDAALFRNDSLFRPIRFSERLRNFEHDRRNLARTAKDRGFAPRRFEDLFSSTFAADATVVGLDLTGSEKRATGVAISRGRSVETCSLQTDDELLDYVRSAQPDIVSIDSPLSIPAGRTSVFDDDPGRNEFGIMRLSERILKRRGINVYPCLLPSMQRLTLRGMRIAERLRQEGIPVIESYPGAAQDIVGIARKGAGLPYLVAGLKAFGYEGDFDQPKVSHDELDAVTCCMVGSFFLAGRFEALGSDDEEALVIPELSGIDLPLVIGVSGRIAAGKTTFAKALARRNFGYLRYSQIIDEEIVQRGGPLNRDTRQRVGREINEQEGQRWLGRRLIARMKEGGEGGKWVVDGLRFREDHAFWAERLGPRFVHVHIDAPERIRMARYDCGNVSLEQFQTIDQAPVEREIDGLKDLATHVIANVGTIADLERKAEELSTEIAGIN